MKKIECLFGIILAFCVLSCSKNETNKGVLPQENRYNGEFDVLGVYGSYDPLMTVDYRSIFEVNLINGNRKDKELSLPILGDGDATHYINPNCVTLGDMEEIYIAIDGINANLNGGTVIAPQTRDELYLIGGNGTTGVIGQGTDYIVSTTIDMFNSIGVGEIGTFDRLTEGRSGSSAFVVKVADLAEGVVDLTVQSFYSIPGTPPNLLFTYLTEENKLYWFTLEFPYSVKSLSETTINSYDLASFGLPNAKWKISADNLYVYVANMRPGMLFRFQPSIQSGSVNRGFYSYFGLPYGNGVSCQLPANFESGFVIKGVFGPNSGGTPRDMIAMYNSSCGYNFGPVTVPGGNFYDQAYVLPYELGLNDNYPIDMGTHNTPAQLEPIVDDILP